MRPGRISLTMFYGSFFFSAWRVQTPVWSNEYNSDFFILFIWIFFEMFCVYCDQLCYSLYFVVLFIYCVVFGGDRADDWLHVWWSIIGSSKTPLLCLAVIHVSLSFWTLTLISVFKSYPYNAFVDCLLFYLFFNFLGEKFSVHLFLEGFFFLRNAILLIFIIYEHILLISAM